MILVCVVPRESIDGYRVCPGADERPDPARLAGVKLLLCKGFPARTGIATARTMMTPRLVLLLFLVAQGWDGIFTYVAVDVHGLAAEANVILVTWMALVGPAPTLLVAKGGAGLCGILLYACGVHRALAGLTVLYGVGAIGP